MFGGGFSRGPGLAAVWLLSPRSLQTLLRPTTLFPIGDDQQADAPQGNPESDEFLSCTVSVVAVGKQSKLTLQVTNSSAHDFILQPSADYS
jgi:hypothetical protein